MAKSLVHVILIFIIKKKNCHSHFVFKEQIPWGRPSLCLYETISHFLFTRLFCQIFQRYLYDFSIGLMVFLSFHENIKKKNEPCKCIIGQEQKLRRRTWTMLFFSDIYCFRFGPSQPGWRFRSKFRFIDFPDDEISAQKVAFP